MASAFVTGSPTGDACPRFALFLTFFSSSVCILRIEWPNGGSATLGGE